MAKKKITKKKVTKKATKKVAKKGNTKKVSKKQSSEDKKKVVKKATKKVAKKVTKKVAKKTAKKVAKKTTKKLAKKEAVKVPVEKKATKKAVAKDKKPSAEDQSKINMKIKKESEQVLASEKLLKNKKTDGQKEGKSSSSADKKESKKGDKKESKKGLKKGKDGFTEEILSLTDEYGFDDIFDAIRHINFFESDTDECLIKNCDNPATTGLYCRLCYIKFWESIKKKELILGEDKLQILLEEIVRKYPIKYVEEILKDLSDEKSFFAVLKEMNIESGEDSSEESEETLDDDQDLSFEAKGANRNYTE